MLRFSKGAVKSRRNNSVLSLVSGAILLFCATAQAQMVSGSAMAGYADTFGVQLTQIHYDYDVHLIESSAPGNILWPGEQEKLTFLVVNNTDDVLPVTGRVEVIGYGSSGATGDVWTPHLSPIGTTSSVPIMGSAPVKGSCLVTVTPDVPERFGGYAFVVDLGPHGRRFLTTVARTFSTNPDSIQYPHFCLDALPLPVLTRLGVHAIRYGVGYKPTTDPDFPAWYAQESTKLQAYKQAGISVLYMVGAGAIYGPTQPMGRPRPLLTDDGILRSTKSDMAWLPSYDEDFQKFCHLIASTQGWPKGPINAFSLWNEPWEGTSISGWGADMLRYRAIYLRMFQGVDDARQHDGVDLLVGGCDSTTNAFDKLFCDGTDHFLPMFDFVSEHYQGLSSVATCKQWMNRTGPHGRVKIWDTESWVANTDDRVGAVIAGDRAAGFDRAMGIFGGNVADESVSNLSMPDGTKDKVDTVEAWSVASAVGAATHFIGERTFDRLLFQNGLPWVMLFDGLPDATGRPRPEDGTVVIVGDLGDEFGADNLPFRTARGFAEVAHKAQLHAQLAALPQDAPDETRTKLQVAIATPETLSGATLTLAAGPYGLFDLYGNPIPAQDGKLEVPLDRRSFYLQPDGSKGSFHELLNAIRAAYTQGIQPVAIVAHDMTAPIETKPKLTLTLTNVLNRPVTASLHVSVDPLSIAAPATVLLAANETRQVALSVTGGQPDAANNYPMRVEVNAGRDGISRLEETLHVNYIAKRTIKVDGDLTDWSGILPQTIIATGSSAPTLTEKAWLPYKTYDDSIKTGVATGYLAYDARNFYFAAKIADSTVDPGMVRMTTRDDDAYFYPDTSYAIDPTTVLQKRDWTLAADPADPRALQNPADPTSRVLAGWADTVKSFAVDVSCTDGATHQLALYLADPDNLGRCRETITLTDADTNKFLDRREIGDFRLGKYVVYTVSGHVRITITRGLDWLATTINGLFFDPTHATPATGTTATFVNIDEKTQGNWKGVYGADGYNVIGAAEKYPAYVTLTVPEHIDKIALNWPDGVRHYSYRRGPELPSGSAPNHDNVQIAFNVLPDSQKPWAQAPPGVMPGFTGRVDTDYEYALNPIAPQYGGGTEIFRLLVPGMPRKNFYPREPASPFDGPVKGGQLVITRAGGTRIVECAIPWTELPAVKQCIDAGKPVKFSFRVNDDAGGPCMELSRERSAAERNSASFHPEWVEHWSNSLEFGVER